METETKEIYKCDFCSRWYQLKRFAESHEKSCTRNPDNYRRCLDNCKHLVKKGAKVYIGIDEYYTSEPIYETRTLLFCEKKSMFLYPPKVEHKGNYYTEFYDEENENKPMMKECNLYGGNNNISGWLDFLNKKA